MGLLKVGKPKKWEDSKKDLRYVRHAGVRQFISMYNRVKDLKGDELLFGDEVEYGIFKLDPETKKVRLSLRAKEVMDQLNENERLHSHRTEGCNWVPEYGAWMVEATPNRPYTGYTNDLLRVERNMRLRRKRLMCVLDENEIAPTISVFPLLGALGDDGSVPPTKVGGDVTLSNYIGDGIINPHPRFGTLSRNIRSRRGEKVCIRVPLFQDINTPEYKGLETAASLHGCCGVDTQQVWRYGRGCASRAKYGDNYLVVGCASTALGATNATDVDGMDDTTLVKWLVNVESPGCKGLFYRSAPNVIVADADWPRNGDIVVGSEIPNIPGWIRLQNGYYLPMASDDGKVKFLHRVSTSMPSNTQEKRNLGSSTPLFRGVSTDANSAQAGALTIEDISSLRLDDTMPAVLTKPVPSMIDEEEVEDAILPNGASLSDIKPISSRAGMIKGSNKPLERVRAAIHMDAMAFGMGCCCLQVTFQAQDVDESRFIYDQLAVLAPVLMALTASTPIVRGRIADTDARWGIISESVDDRTPAERGYQANTAEAIQPELAGKGVRRIYKSRYDSISTYIYQGSAQRGGSKPSLNSTSAGDAAMENRVLNMYNDLIVPIEEDMYHQLRANGIDPALSQHIAHLFIRDPLVIFDGYVEELDDSKDTDHFESIQSTNWQTVRWKPPPPRNTPNDPHIGWRTEFRSMEMQLTDFENAAFTIFIVLVTRVILTFDLNLYIPLSRVDANMQRAHSRNSCAKGKFFFRRHMAPLEEGDDGYGVKYTSMFAPGSASSSNSAFETLQSFGSEGSEGAVDSDDTDLVSSRRKQSPFATGHDEANAYEEMTMEEIMCGKGDYYPGLIPLVFAYLDHIQCDKFTFDRVSQYLHVIEKRAKGELLTPATWMRNFVRSHPAYKQDSVVSDEIAYDLLTACKEIGEGTRHEPTLLGDLKFERITKEGAYDVKLDSRRIQNDHLIKLLDRYRNRVAFKNKVGSNSSGSSMGL